MGIKWALKHMLTNILHLLVKTTQSEPGELAKGAGELEMFALLKVKVLDV